MSNRFETMKPRQVEAYLRESVRKIFGDVAENGADIFSSHGYYNIEFALENSQWVMFKNFRKGDVPKIVKAMKALV